MPNGIRRPYAFFECLCVLDEKEWKTAEKVSLETSRPLNMIRQYLRIAKLYNLVERKRLAQRGYVYRLNREWKEWKGSLKTLL